MARMTMMPEGIKHPTAAQQWQYANFTNAYMFTEVLRSNKALTERIIRLCVPDLGDFEIIGFDREVTQQTSVLEKSGRLDVRIRLKDGRIILIEMQVRKQKYFVRRIRFYQSEADIESLDPGDEEYHLPDIIQISVCDFDPVGKGQYIYDFEYRDRREPGIRMNDGTRKIFLNIRGKNGEVTEEQKAFISYLRGRETEDALCGEIDDTVRQIKDNEDRRRNFMKLKDYLYEERVAAREEGLAEGRAEGKAEGKAEAIRELVLRKLDKGLTPEETAELFELPLETVKEIAAEA